MKKTNYEFNFLFQKSKRGAVAEIKVINIQIRPTAAFSLDQEPSQERTRGSTPSGRRAETAHGTLLSPQAAPSRATSPEKSCAEALSSRGEGPAPPGPTLGPRRDRTRRPLPHALEPGDAPPVPGVEALGVGVGRRGKAPPAPPPTPSPTPHPWGPASKTAPLSRTLRGGQAPPPPTPPPASASLPQAAPGRSLGLAPPGSLRAQLRRGASASTDHFRHPTPPEGRPTSRGRCRDHDKHELKEKGKGNRIAFL